VISQSAQFAPFSHDYVYLNDTEDEWKVYDPSITYANNYKYVSDLQDDVLLTTLVPSCRGSALSVTSFCIRPRLISRYFLSHRQQAISGLTKLPSDVFEGSGGVLHTFGLSWFLFFLWPFLIGFMQASNTLHIPSRAQTGTSFGRWTANRR